MTTVLYTVRDKVAEESGPIFQAKNDGVALRQYQNLLAKQERPDDFELYKIGEFDNETMQLLALKLTLVTPNLSQGVTNGE